MEKPARRPRSNRSASRARAAPPLSALALVFAACATFPGGSLARPDVELQSLRITGVGFGGGTLELVLDVYNPNDFALRALRTEARLRLEETDFGTAALEEAVRLPPMASATLEVPLSFTWEGAGAGARQILERGSADYTLDTEFFLETPVGEGSVEVTSRGTVTVEDVVR